mgnify:CR=1 FL=1
MMEKVSGFIIVWKLRFHTIINAPRGSHCSGMEECRLRDPPQAENPASQDSFLHNFQVPGIIELRIIGKIMLELEIIPNGAACCKRERCEAAVF